MEDNLKSLKAEEDITVLVKNIRAICTGGFNFARFIIHSNIVPETITDNARRIGVQEHDLFGDLPEEQAIGVLWNNGGYKPGLKVNTGNIKKKLLKKGNFMTRKGLVCIETAVPLHKETTKYQEVPHSINN